MEILSGGGIAILHDSFARCGEAERVTEEIAKMLPDADILSTVSVEEKLSRYIKSRQMTTTWMQHLPATHRLYRHYCLLYPLAILGLNLSRYDIVISSCMGFAKGAIRAHGAVHICYCHGPTRWMWNYDQYAEAEGLNFAMGLLLKPLLMGVRQMDIQSSARPDYYIAKSQAVADQIKLCYDRNAYVIHPPIDVSRFHFGSTVGDYFLIVSPLLPHKRIDMAIAACNSVGKRLLIAGEGPDRARLEALAGPTVYLLGLQTESEVAELIACAQALLSPSVEDDFDLMPIKANAAGRPVIAFAAGSALETVIDGFNGVLYAECSRPAIVEAMKRSGELTWNRMTLRAYAREFDVPVFRERFTAMLRDILGSKAVVGAAA